MPTLNDLQRGYVGYPNLMRQAQKMREASMGRIVENIQDPKTYGLVRGLLGATPEDLDVSVLSPKAQAMKEAAYYGNQLSNLAQIAPVAKPLEAGAMAAGRAGERYAEKVVPQIMEKGGLGAQLLQDLSQGSKSQLTVWHGSPYRFDKFDATKIGSGEGNQVYGHGLYMAEAPAVAEGYQKRLAGAADPYTYNWQGQQYEGGVRNDPVAHALGLAYHQSPKVARDIAKQGLEGVKAGEPWALEKGEDYFRKMYETAVDVKKKDIKAVQGALYKVDLPDEKIAQMLDWDKPVPEEMRQKLSKVMLEKFGSGATGTSGEKLYKEIQKSFEWAGSKTPAQDASAFLHEQGIPGVRYLDAGSRKKGGTSNFVVFDPNYLTILERNGMPIK